MARIPALIAAGRRGQAARIWVRSGSAGGGKIAAESACEEDGTSIGTASFGPCRKSFVSPGFTSSGLQSSEPKVRGSNPLGCTRLTSNCRPICTRVHINQLSRRFSSPVPSPVRRVPPEALRRPAARRREHSTFGWSPKMHDASPGRSPAEGPQPHGAAPRMIA